MLSNKSNVTQFLDTELFIEAIQKKKSLWDNSSEDYKNRQLVKNHWNDIAAEMCPNFDTMSTADKDSITKDLQRKWRNIRDAYVRYLRSTRMDPTQVRRLAKPYRYVRNLDFLKNYVNLPTESSVFVDTIKTENLSFEEVEEIDNSLPSTSEVDNVFEDSRFACSTMNRNNEEVQNKVNICVSPFQFPIENRVNGCPRTSQLPPLQPPEREEFSDDVDFFCSLLPMLRTMPMQDKLKFRMEVMKTLLEYLPK